MSTTSDVNAALRRLQGEMDRLTRERDEAIHAAAEGNGCAQALERQLAASQAECAALREAALTPEQLRGLASWMVRHGAVETDDAAGALTVLLLRNLADKASRLSRQSGDYVALREMLTEAVDAGRRHGGWHFGCVGTRTQKEQWDGDTAAIVARLLGPQATEEGGAK